MTHTYRMMYRVKMIIVVCRYFFVQNISTIRTVDIIEEYMGCIL